MHQRKRPTRPAGFTLLEMLTVIAIMVVLLSIVIPASSNLVASNRLTAAGNLVASLAAFARQEAMGGNTMTALVMLARQGTGNDGRAFTVLRYDPARGWQQSQPWAVLPTGIVVDMSDTAACSFMLDSSQPFPFLKAGQANPPVKYQGVQLQATGSYAARLFLPGGGLVNADIPTHIRLVEGEFKEGSIVHTRGTPPTNYVDITIIGDTGQIKIDRP